MLRGFTDSTGVEWRVWEVSPTRISTLGATKSFTSASLANTVFAGGWLCFESTTEKRRLAPIPSEWHQHETASLEQLLSRATPVTHRRREPVGTS
jgi:hypothetical protein